MIRFRSLVRVLALMLLLLAAGDLLIEGACEDGTSLTTTASAFSADSAAAGHTGEDCYCCSRTARSEAPQGLLPVVGELERRQDDVLRLPKSPSSVPYHPPLI